MRCIIIVMMWVALLQAEPRLGMNLNGPTDWSTEFCFTNLFYLSREWVSHAEGKGWGQGPKLSLDKNGWIKELKPGCWAETLMLTHSKGHHPKGEYVCLYEGEGEIDFSITECRVISREPGKIVLNLDQNTQGLFFRIKKTNPQNYIRNIRIIMPGFESSYKENPFTPEFLSRWKDFDTFRFMDWAYTNNSNIEKWEDRPTLQDMNFTTKGAPLELMIELCNKTKINPWFCMPHQADDHFIREFAKQVKNRLDPDLKIYIEYSNEVWNSGFEQYHYTEKKGKELGLMPHEGPWAGAASFYALRSKEIFMIWEEVFGGSEKLQRVISWHALIDPDYWTDERVLKQHDVYEHTDVLAIAPYFGLLAGPHTKPSLSTIEKWSLDQVFDYLEKIAIPETYLWMKNQKRIADKYGLKFCCYESGQHLVGIEGGEASDTLTALFLSANKHPRMGKLYTRYLNNWKTLKGDLMCHFSSTATWSMWGSWGLTEYMDVSEEECPKYKAVMDWIRENQAKDDVDSCLK